MTRRKRYTKFDLTAPQLIDLVALVIVLAGGIITFQAWLLGIVLGWFGVTLAFWQSECCDCAAHWHVIRWFSEQQLTPVTVGGLDTIPARGGLRSGILAMLRGIPPCELMLSATELPGRTLPLTWIEQSTSPTI
jgi:hypothetical protein